MPEQVFNENDSREMQTLKNQIRNSDLDGQVKSYGERNKIVFYAFQVDDMSRVLRFFFDERNNDLVAAFFYRERDNQGQRRQWSRQICQFRFDQETAFGNIQRELRGFRRDHSEWGNCDLNGFNEIVQ